ncbi:hypothetical protein Ddye_018279 [Dipteronia dyeriana]|uniref:F-box domain-containing protein n=1 Tax=Dipteronia dyeriana TaxID=168575 RepID=A0AAD9X201_9ROSI|nr:hypothetical protein Ddye_018279 [Dipteronia dyeriana]
MTGMQALPEGCIAVVISFTTPRDTCHLACISTTFKLAIDSDVFVFFFYYYVVAGRLSALSKKELYFRICHDLIHKGKMIISKFGNLIRFMSFWFDILNGKKCYMISSRELNIDDAILIAFTLNKVLEVLIRREVNPFEIVGKINTSLISPMTTYVAYLMFVGGRHIFHRDGDPVEVTIGLAGSIDWQNRAVYFHQENQDGDDDGFFPKKKKEHIGGWKVN